jgi:hypothetical protein
MPGLGIVLAERCRLRRARQHAHSVRDCRALPLHPPGSAARGVDPLRVNAEGAAAAQRIPCDVRPMQGWDARSVLELCGLPPLTGSDGLPLFMVGVLPGLAYGCRWSACRESQDCATLVAAPT